jgi:hypothetical protein
MLITTKPEKLEAKADHLEKCAAAAEEGGRPLTAMHLRSQVDALRKQAAELRGRRTDGVRFG